jgi:hypothetical protein
MIIPIILLGVSIFQIRKINKKIKALKELNMRGKLIKGLTYRLVDSHISINDVPLKVLVVDYTLPNGNKIELKGDSRFDRKLRDEDGLVDLLIDELYTSIMTFIPQVVLDRRDIQIVTQGSSIIANIRCTYRIDNTSDLSSISLMEE